MINVKEMELIEKKELRESVVHKTDVLDKVGNLLLLPNTECSTTEQVSKYYNVDDSIIRVIINRHREELESDGIKLVKKSEIERSLQNATNVKILKYKSHIEIVSNDEKIKIANRGSILFTKRATLRVGMLLRDSEVAKEVRTRLLDIVHDVEKENPEIIHNIVEEMSQEKLIYLKIGEAISSGDIMALAEANTELNQIKNKRIQELETRNKNITTNALTIIESKAVINRITRTIAMKKYSNESTAFAKSFNEFYSLLNYKLGINIKSREKKDNSLLSSLTEEELFQAEQISRNWASENGLDLDKILKLC